MVGLGVSLISFLSPPPHNTDMTNLLLFLMVSALNVTAFGAKGDGVTDDRASIQAALNSAKLAGGGTVLFPKGTYALSAYLVLEGASNIKLEGNEGVLKALPTMTVENSQGDLLKILRSKNISIERLIFDANGKERGRKAATVTLRLGGVNGFKIRNSTFLDGTGDHIYLAAEGNEAVQIPSENGLIENNTLNRAYRNAISIIHAHHIRIVNNTLEGSEGQDPQAGIDIESNANDLEGANHHIYITRNKILKNKRVGIKIVGMKSPHHIYIHGNLISDSEYGLVQNWAGPTGIYNVSDVEITDNHIQNIQRIGLGVVGYRQLVRGNLLFNGSDFALYAEGTNHKFQENVVINFGRKPDGPSGWFIGGMGKNLVEKNFFYLSPVNRSWEAMRVHATDIVRENHRHGMMGGDGEF